MIQDEIPAILKGKGRYGTDILNPDAEYCDLFISYLNNVDDSKEDFTALQEKWLDYIIKRFKLEKIL